MFETLKKLIKESGIYALGDFLTRGTAFLLLPLYTAYMTPKEYGIFSIAIAIATIFGIVSTLGLKSSTLKYYYDFGEDERKEFYGSVWIVYITLPSILLVALEIYGEVIFSHLLPEIGYTPYLRLAFWAIFLTLVFYEFPLQIFIAKGEAKKHSILNILIFSLTTAITIWLVVFQDEGVFGMLFAKLMGRLIISFFAGYYLFKFIKIHFRWSHLKKALIYSTPLIPHFLSHWVLSSSDRLVLEYYLPLSEVGIYNVGYTIGTSLSIIAIAGNNSLIPLYGKLKLDSDESVKNIISLTTYYILVVVTLGLFILLCSKSFVNYFIDISYNSSVIVIPWVILGFVFMAFYYTQINLLTITLGRTRLVGIATALAAITNLVLNIIFIPKFGISGAAITTSLTYLLLFLGVLIVAYNEFALKFEYWRFFKILAISVIVYFVFISIKVNNLLQEILLVFFTMLLYLIIMALTRVFTKSEINFIKKKLYKS